jgi:hypothetical protein
MPRKAKIIDEEEVQEIITLYLENLGGDVSKISYNGAWQYNKKLVKEKRNRKNGGKFVVYGYSFWASSNHKGEEYVCKRMIDKLKQEHKNEMQTVGIEVKVQYQDVLQIIKKYISKPDLLAKKITNLFKKDRKNNVIYRARIDELNMLLKNERKKNKIYEEFIFNIFYNSKSPNNSLLDIMRIKKPENKVIKDELENVFDGEDSELGKMINEYKNKSNEKILSLVRRNRLEDEGF